MDAVRESQSELLDEDRARKSRIKSLTKDVSKELMFPGSKSSRISNKTEVLKSVHSKHKCHGQSPET